MTSNGFPSQLFQCLKLGILHIPSGKFLTAENFINEINISGTALRRKQNWTVFADRKRSDVVYLQNHLGRFLSSNKDGKVTTVSGIPDAEERFRLEFSPDGTGEWAFKSDAHDYYLTASEKQISCFSKSPVWWSIRLANHPQVHLYQQFRGRYLRLVNDGSEVRADQAHPWGQESVIWLEQPALAVNTGFARPNTQSVGRGAVSRLGRVAIRMSNGKYLKPDGELSDEMDDSVLYSLEFKPGSPCLFAFKAANGAYLTTVGQGNVKCKPINHSPGKEELFLIERTALQVGLLAHNKKFASVKQGFEISANQHDIDETGTFLLEYIGGTGFNTSELLATTTSSIDGPDLVESSTTTNGATTMNTNMYLINTGFWRLRSNTGKLWKFAPSSSVMNSASDGDPDSLFEIYLLNKPITDICDKSTPKPQQRHVVLRCNPAIGDGQSLSARKLGALSTSGRVFQDNIHPNVDELFNIVLINRLQIVFISLMNNTVLTRGKQNVLDANGLVAEQFLLRLTKNNNYIIYTRDSKSHLLWCCKPDGSIQLEPSNVDPAADENQEFDLKNEFQLHLLGQNCVLIQSICSTKGPLLLRTDAKGNCKLEELAGELTSNYVWLI